MKKFIPILISFFSLIYISQAQLSFLPTLANELLSNARTEAAAKITNPQLLSIATINGTIPGLEIGGQAIDLAFTTDDGADKGKASAWVFLFNSKDNPSQMVAMVTGMTMVGPLAIDPADYSVDISPLEEYVTDNVLDDFTWMNSDIMVDHLKASTEYTNFLATYPDAIPKMVALGFADAPNLNPTNPYWFVSMNAVTDSLVIIIDALTGNVTDVSESITDGIIVYPNPAQNVINTVIPNAIINQNTKITILNNTGNKVKDISGFNLKNFQINLNGLSSGNYYLRLKNQSSNKLVPFVIVK